RFPLIETEGTGAKEMDLPKIDAEALIAAYGDGAYEQARREARKMLVGKTGFGPSCKQDDINALMVGLAKQGKRVVRLKGGDPLIFGRAAEEIATCKAANIAVDVV